MEIIMNKILIVEDEKMIRQGLYVMVMRSSVSVEEIILCKNGQEAYEVISNEKIDILITDIRMPKMDGIELVKKIQNLNHIPKVMVISGYDDFTYAVELMRYGVKEYILKPVEREKIEQVLKKLEIEINKEQELELEYIKIGYQQLKYMLMYNHMSESEIIAIETRFRDYIIKEEYVICCTNYKVKEHRITNKNAIILEDINGQSACIISVSIKDEFINNQLKGYYVGVSDVHTSIRELKAAYEEAFYARKRTFATSTRITEFNHQDKANETVSEDILDQLVQMIGTDKYENASKILSRIIYKTNLEQVDMDQFCLIMSSIIDKICITYKNVLDFSNVNYINLKNIYEYDNLYCYHEALSSWMKAIHDKLEVEFDDYKNKQKIQIAIKYIQENYNKDINMAVVSNYVSMNYSLFSYLFKQYNGMNFVNYVKTIRINEATKLLEETELKIIDISNYIGYENEKHFMKVFRGVYGVSPSEYRKNVQVGKNS
jgi:two-component system response regulator YesN